MLKYTIYLTIAQWVALSPALGPRSRHSFSAGFASSFCVDMGALVSPLSKDNKDRSIGDSKLPLGVSVNACVSAVMDWPSIQGDSLPTAQDTGIG